MIDPWKKSKNSKPLEFEGPWSIFERNRRIPNLRSCNVMLISSLENGVGYWETSISVGPHGSRNLQSRNQRSDYSNSCRDESFFQTELVKQIDRAKEINKNVLMGSDRSRGTEEIHSLNKSRGNAKSCDRNHKKVRPDGTGQALIGSSLVISLVNYTHHKSHNKDNVFVRILDMIVLSTTSHQKRHCRLELTVFTQFVMWGSIWSDDLSLVLLVWLRVILRFQRQDRFISQIFSAWFRPYKSNRFNLQSVWLFRKFEVMPRLNELAESRSIAITHIPQIFTALPSLLLPHSFDQDIYLVNVMQTSPRVRIFCPNRFGVQSNWIGICLISIKLNRIYIHETLPFNCTIPGQDSYMNRVLESSAYSIIKHLQIS